MVTGLSTASEEDNNKSACSHLKEVLGDSPPVFLVSPPYLIIQKCHHPTLPLVRWGEEEEQDIEGASRDSGPFGVLPLLISLSCSSFLDYFG